MLNTASERIRVLIVDDDFYFNTNVLGYALERRGFEVFHAYTAKEFEQLWKAVEVIVLDIRLPEEETMQVEPWCGLRTLYRLQQDEGSSIPRQLETCVIRSAATRADANRSNIPLPQFSQWFSPDTPLSVLVEAVRRSAAWAD